MTIRLLVLSMCAGVMIGCFTMSLFKNKKEPLTAPIPFEAPPANADVLLLLTNRECFRINGNSVLLFRLSDEEWSTIKKWKTPGTNGWLWITK